MSARLIDAYVCSMLDDLDLRLDADFEHAHTLVKYHTHAGDVAEVIDEIITRMLGNTIDAAVDLTPKIGINQTLLVLGGAKSRMLRDICLLEAELNEIAMFGYNHIPYRPSNADNPYRIEPNQRNSVRGNEEYRSYRDQPKKKAAHKPKPTPVPAEGLGPKLVPQKSKKKDEAKWETGQNNTWGSSENWEDLALHAAYKDKLDTEKDQKMVTEDPKTPKNGAKLAKKGKA